MADFHDSDGPLVAGKRYALTLYFEASSLTRSASTESAASDAGHRMTLHLFGEGVDVEDSSLSVSLPGAGPSSEARTFITVLNAGGCALRVFVTYEHGAEVLQSLRIGVPVQAAPESGRFNVTG
jgi:hypothetical protein